jgi:hypothetical protein
MVMDTAGRVAQPYVVGNVICKGRHPVLRKGVTEAQAEAQIRAIVSSRTLVNRLRFSKRETHGIAARQDTLLRSLQRLAGPTEGEPNQQTSIKLKCGSGPIAAVR